jgi:serralysin
VLLGAGNDYFDSRGGSFVGANAAPVFLSGGDGYDQLYCGAGSQDIDGGLADDTMSGGGGDDIYHVDSAFDLVFEDANAGIDAIWSSVSVTLPANVETLGLTGALAAKGIGNALANTIYGAVANPTFLYGLAGKDTIYGNNASDTIDGGSGNDYIDGVGGVDTLNGGLGNDTLRGLVGADKFLFNTKPNSATNRDTILDFEHLHDRILLENAIFTKLGAHGLTAAYFHVGAQAADANDYVVYNNKTGVLSYDLNGNAAGGAVPFAVLKGLPVLTAADFLVV